MPPTIIYGQPSAQPGVKLSKLLEEVRQLGCETLPGLVDVVVANNWLKMVSSTLIDMELDDDLELRVAMRLIDKSTTT